MRAHASTWREFAGWHAEWPQGKHGTYSDFAQRAFIGECHKARNIH